MKKWLKIFGSLVVSVSFLGALSSCTDNGGKTNVAVCEEDRDICGELKFDKNSGRKYLETTVHAYVNGYQEAVPYSGCIDGDTVHFDIENDPNFPDHIIKARFLCIDTPESTGQVQPWGSTAKKFTKEKLSNAKSIIIESETKEWNKDSNGERYMLYVWYKNEGGDYRNLNLEIMQNGLAAAKGINGTVYADKFNEALSHAKSCKLKYWSGEKDPNFFGYGTAENVSIKALRTDPTKYLDKKVRFEGDVTYIADNKAYAQDYDQEEERYYGFQVYMGYTNYPIIKVGRRISFCGTVQQHNDDYQLSGLTYQYMRDHEDNLHDVGEGNTTPTTVTADDLEDTNNADKLIATYCRVENLTVKSVYTTTNDTDSNGSMTLTCVDKNNKEFSVRTSRLTKTEEEGGTLYTESDFLDKTMNCLGIMEKYGDKYQLHLFSYNDVEFVNNN